MAAKRITLEVDVWASRETHGGHNAQLSEVRDVGVHSYRSEKEAKVRLGVEVVKRLRAGVEAEKNSRRTIVGCGDGTVLMVCFSGSWGYYISGPERSRASSCWSSPNSGEEETLRLAREHAAQCFGGVSWETSVP